MNPQTHPQFLHNHASSMCWKSVCPACFKTVMVAESEKELSWVESFHICEEERLQELRIVGLTLRSPSSVNPDRHNQ